MLNQLGLDPRMVVFLQAALVAALAGGIAWVARRHGIDLLRELLIAMARGFVQILVVGLVLLALLRGPWWTGPFVLAAMAAVAGRTSARRIRKLPGVLRVSTYSIALGAGSVILLMTIAGVIESGIASLVPLGSMVVANAMNANTLALERFRSDMQAHRGEVESALALGAAPRTSIAPYLRNAVRASIISPVDSLRSLGIVWIPGVMTGMVLSGAAPLHAAVYQFVVLVMIFAASALTCMISTYLIAERAFTPAEQLAWAASD